MKQEQIEQAARKYGCDAYIEYCRQHGVDAPTSKYPNLECAFITGANWALSNQWHDAKTDKPDLSCPIFAHLSFDGLSIPKYRNPQTLNLAIEPYKHYYDMAGEEVPISAIRYWMKIPTLEGGED